MKIAGLNLLRFVQLRTPQHRRKAAKIFAGFIGFSLLFTVAKEHRERYILVDRVEEECAHLVENYHRPVWLGDNRREHEPDNTAKG